MAIDRILLKELRNRTGLGLSDCRKALEASSGDIEKAVEELRKKGAIVAAKRSDKSTTEGIIATYVHPGDRLGVMVEINCETDFVARTDAVRTFAKDLALQVAASKPLYLDADDVDEKFLAHEKGIIKEQLEDSGKAEKILNQIIDGKINKLYSDICLVRQTFIKNDQFTVDEVLKELIAKTGENIKIRRFSRFEIGA